MCIILGSVKDQKSIEKDLKEIAKSVKIRDRDEDYNPKAFDFIVQKLLRKGYVECRFVNNPLYQVREGKLGHKGQRNYFIVRRIENAEWGKI